MIPLPIQAFQGTGYAPGTTLSNRVDFQTALFSGIPEEFIHAPLVKGDTGTIFHQGITTPSPLGSFFKAIVHFSVLKELNLVSCIDIDQGIIGVGSRIAVVHREFQIPICTLELSIHGPVLPAGHGEFKVVVVGPLGYLRCEIGEDIALL